LFIIENIRLPKIEILLNYEVNTGNPIVAVVIRAPAKIKKGRKGKFFKDKHANSKLLYRYLYCLSTP